MPMKMAAMRRQGQQPAGPQFVRAPHFAAGILQEHGNSGFDADNFFDNDFTGEMPQPGYQQPPNANQNAASYARPPMYPLPTNIQPAPHGTADYAAYQLTMQPYRQQLRENTQVILETPANQRTLGLNDAVEEYLQHQQQQNQQQQTFNNPPQVPANNSPDSPSPVNQQATNMPPRTRREAGTVSPGEEAEDEARTTTSSRVRLEDFTEIHKMDELPSDSVILAATKTVMLGFIKLLWTYICLCCKRNAELRARHGRLLEEKKALEKQNSQLVKNGAKASVNDAVKAELAKLYRNNCFRNAPFIRNLVDAKTVAERLYDLYFTKHDATKLESTSYKETWLNGYIPNINRICNKRRSYIQSQCKLAVLNYHEVHKEMPSLDDIKRCALRQINVEDKHDYDMMKWYWGNIAGKVVGCEHWNDSHKFYTQMSKACYKDSNLTLFTASTEAYIYIMVDNCFEKWQATCELFAKRGDYKSKLGIKRKTKAEKAKKKAKKSTADDDEEEDDEAMTAEEEEEDKIDGLFQAKYSSADNGQVFSSFSKEGRVEHVRVKKEIIAAREDSGVYGQIELDFLKRYREENKITGATYQEQCKLKGLRKRKRSAGEGVVIEEESNENLDSEEGEIDFDEE